MKPKRPQGRPPTRAAVPYQMTESIQSYMNGNMLEHGGLPRPERLQSVLAAVLSGIGRRDPEYFRFCLQRIATIANLDVALYVPEDRIEYEVNSELTRIVLGQLLKETHQQGTLQSQRGALLDFFQQEHFPHDTRDSRIVKKWLADRWSRIVDLLTLIPCSCMYGALSYEEFRADKITQAHSRWWSQARTANLVLALVHKTTPANEERILKAPHSQNTAPIA